MPSRRAYLAALAAMAGCTNRSPDATPTATPSETARGSPTPTSTPTNGSVPVRWRHETPHEALDIVSLAPGADGPAVYVGSDGGSEGADGHAIHAIGLADGTEQWRVSLPTPAVTSPVYAEGEAGPRVYVATRVSSETAELYALDPSRGTRVWGFDAPARRRVYPMGATGDTVFVGTRDDDVARSGEAIHALAAEDGRERWRVESGDALATGHAVRRNTLLARTPARLRALDVETGAERWRIDSPTVMYGPAVRDERVFVGYDGTVRAVGLADGRERWRRDVDFSISGVLTPHAAASTTVFVADRAGRLLALSPLDGSTRWTLSVDTDAFRPHVVRTSERLFVGGQGVYALDPVSGERAWSFTPGAVDVTVHASTTVFAAVGRDRMHALDPASGTERWRFAPGPLLAGPATAGDLAFVGVEGTVYALDGSRTASGDS
ncbi:PQQ-binding-like beta-propeller repeat protein [Haloplanus halobius]|uniref:outer membrane protein assembly factor BamB family protein n=1 Tax=Haloplanus halobius TaxID=2934938 RepID=UPI00200F3300|nr:PQQ-binding-like beta-propeller repeat protein [Haloplanus sp. XH21]